MLCLLRQRCSLQLRPRSRPFSVSCYSKSRRNKDRINFNPPSSIHFGDEDDTAQLAKLTRLDSRQLASHRDPPRGIKALTRDFIHDSLYNPHYGYFTKHAVIFSLGKPFDFRNMRDSTVFDGALAEMYQTDNGQHVSFSSSPGTQLWHTPVELFQPYYGQAIAQCLASEYLLKHFPYEDFVVYEMGGGNGTLALNILDYLRDEYPEIYERTQYRIIEISPNLARIQREKLIAHSSVVQTINKSIFDWDEYVHSPCFFVALEVIDNFAHDVARYSLKTLQPYQALTSTSDQGEFEEIYEPITDPLILRYLDYRDRAGHTPPALSSFFTSSATLRRVRSQLPFAPNLSRPEFLPTQLLSFLETLRDKFPLHRLLLSDFSSLPDTIGGGAFNAPVVQTRYQNVMVPCSTYMVQPGYFDIFFPTNFELLRDMYDLVMTSARPLRGRDTNVSPSALRLDANFFSSRGRRRSPLDVAGVTSSSGRTNVYTHQDFLRKYSDVDATTLRNGENPMLDYYSNVKFLF